MEDNNTVLPGTEEPGEETGAEDETVSGNDTGTQQPEPDQEEPEGPEQQKPPEETDRTDQPEKPDGQPGSGQTDNRPAFDRQQFEESITETLENLKEPDRTDELTERLDRMIQLLTLPEEEEEPAVHSELSVPPSGYTEYEYPVRVTYGITTATGYSTYVSMEYGSAEAFGTGFNGMETDVAEGNLKSFYVRYVYGSDSEGYNVLLYDSETPVGTPEEPEEPDDTAAALLSHLEGISTYLADMAAADEEYYNAQAAYREEMLKLQTAETACTVFLCIAVFMVIAQLLFSELFRRFK